MCRATPRDLASPVLLPNTLGPACHLVVAAAHLEALKLPGRGVPAGRARQPYTIGNARY